MMAQHGYLREFDEGWDRGGGRESDRNRDQERGERDRDDRSRDRDRDRDRGGFMFDDGDRSGGDRNRLDRMGDRARDRFREEDRQYRGSRGEDWSGRDRDDRSIHPEQGYGGYQSEFDRSPGEHSAFTSRGDWERSPRSFGSGQDDHYRSWRDRQMEALDRDYADYCREREQQFHSDFDTWRQNRQRGGNKSTDNEIAEVAERERAHERALAGQGSTPSAVGAATLGTNNSENTGTGRAKPSV